VITLAATNLALRPAQAHRSNHRPDRAGQLTEASRAEPHAAKRVSPVLESKLNLLGQKFRGAREDATELRHDVDQLLSVWPRSWTSPRAWPRSASLNRRGRARNQKIRSTPSRCVWTSCAPSWTNPGKKKNLVKDIDVLSREVQRLDRVVKTFLDFSRPVEVHF